MGLVKADWHITVTGVDKSDPFAGLETARRTDPLKDLADLIREEADLDGCGVKCALKDRDWAHPTCSSCPERGDVDRAALCRVGLAQEKVIALV